MHNTAGQLQSLGPQQHSLSSPPQLMPIPRDRAINSAKLQPDIPFNCNVGSSSLPSEQDVAPMTLYSRSLRHEHWVMPRCSCHLQQDTCHVREGGCILEQMGRFEAGTHSRRRARCQKNHELRHHTHLAIENCGMHRCTGRMQSACLQARVSTSKNVMKMARRTLRHM